MTRAKHVLPWVTESIEEDALLTTDEPLSAVTSVVSVDGMSKTIGVVESCAKEIDRTVAMV